jgi:putative membrane protein
MNHSNFGTDMGFGMGASMWIFWIILLLAVAIIIRFMMNGPKKPGDTSSDSPLQILEKRYARGEIDQTEFENLKKGLGKK